MCEVPIFYATTEGQTQRIAERIAEQIRKHGLDSRAVAIISQDASHIDWPKVRGVAVGASLHRGKHQGEAEAFARLHCKDLSSLPSLFFSVSLAAASRNAGEIEAARVIAAGFASTTGWQPTRIATIAGRLAYTQYNWFLRRFMRRIAIKEGASGDMTRDHEYTDWDLVEQIADDLAYEIRRREIFPVTAGSSVRVAS
jgi:menaquinone-dependent protoporphyrinogen oxidase